MQSLYCQNYNFHYCDWEETDSNGTINFSGQRILNSAADKKKKLSVAELSSVNDKQSCMPNYFYKWIFFLFEEILLQNSVSLQNFVYTLRS